MKLDMDAYRGMSMAEYLEKGILEPGMVITFQEGTQLVIGNCTPYMQPTRLDGGAGWDYSVWSNLHIAKIQNFGYDSIDMAECEKACDLFYRRS
jgi:hypothetical protein